MRGLVLLTPVVLLGACTGQPTEEIGFGTYSGSTADNQAVTVSVAGSSIFVNEKKTELKTAIDNRSFVVKKEREQRATFVDDSAWSCRPVLDGAELVCTVTWNGGTTETIELMKE